MVALLAGWLALLTLAAIFVPAEAAARQSPCQNRDLQFASNPPLVRDALLCEIAHVRRTAQTLQVDVQLDLAAGRHAADMVERRYFSHVSPGGGDLAERARRTGYAARGCTWRVGEVLAWGAEPRATAAATVRAWMNSPGHRRILVSRRYRDVGIGLAAGTPLEAFPSGVTVAALLGRRDC
jgi:uncharacterized protein YkwD